MVDEALARAIEHQEDGDWTRRSLTVRRLSSQITVLFSEAELDDGLWRLRQVKDRNESVERAVVLLELASILYRSDLRFG